LALILTCDPRYAPALVAELTERGISCPLRPLAPGIFLAKPTGSDPVAIWRILQQDAPIFLRHMFPVQQEVAIKGDKLDLLRLTESCGPLLANMDEEGPVAVQCRILPAEPSYRPIDVKKAMDDYLQNRGMLTTVKEAALVISVLVAPERAYSGISSPRANLSSWSGGAVHYGKDIGVLSRAAHKLEEACEVFDLDLKGLAEALDLGAAPGGFTSFLLGKGLCVTAVDTGELAPLLLQNPRLSFLKENASNIRPQEASFDLITCDISRDALRTVDMITDLAYCLRPAGKLLLTVKFMGREPLPLIRQCRKRLGDVFRFVRGRHLWHNREEATLYFVKEDRGGE